MRLHINRLIDLAACMYIAFFSVFLITNREYHSIPNPDIFQYINDGRQYARGAFPVNTQMPPAYSLLITWGAQLLSSHPYPELLSSQIITISSAVITLAFLYGLIRRYSRITGILVILLVSTSPVFVFASLDVNTEVFFTPFAVAALMAYKHKRFLLAYGVAGLSFLVRYEGLLLIFTLFLMDRIQKRSVWLNTRPLLLSLIPVIVWIGISQNNNPSGHLLGNAYVQEIFQFKEGVPQFILFERFPVLLMDYVHVNTNDGPVYTIIQFLLYAAITFGAGICIFSKDVTLRGMVIFTVMYLVFHSFFPFAPDRYLYPVLWGVYFFALFGIWWRAAPRKRVFRIVRYVGTIIVIIIALEGAAGNYLRSKGYYEATTIFDTAYPRYARLEIRLAADWLNTQVFTAPVTVVTYEPWIMSYYVKNTNVKFLDASFREYQACSSLTCLIEQYAQKLRGRRVLVILQSGSVLVDSSFPSAYNLNVRIFNNFPNSEEKNMYALLTHIKKYDAWATVYEYTPNQKSY